MNKTMGLLFFTLLLAGLANATPTTIVLTDLNYNGNQSPVYINPVLHPLGITFTVENTDYNSDMNMNLGMVLSDNAVFDLGLDENIPVSVGNCTGSDFSVEQTCTVSWNPSTISLTDGEKYLIIQTNIPEQTQTDQISTNVTLDRTLPSISVTLTPAPIGTYVDSNVPVITASITDSGSSPDQNTFVFRLDGNIMSSTDLIITDINNGFTAEYTVPNSSPLSQGTFTLGYTIEDLAGNSGTPSSFSYSVDTIAPNFSSFTGENYVNTSTPTFTFSASDSTSGMYQLYLQCGNLSDYNSFTVSPVSYSSSISTFNITMGTGCNSSEGSRAISAYVTDTLNHKSSIRVFIFIYDVTKPGNVQGLQYTVTNTTHIELEWDAVTGDTSGINKYIVYRSSSSDFNSSSTQGSTTGLTYAQDVSTCSDYYYWVKAQDNAGNTSNEVGTGKISTLGCSNNNNNDNSDDDDDDSGGSGGTGSGGNSACNVTFTIPANVYANETISVKVESSGTYSGGHFRAFATGKPSVTINRTGTTADEWSGTIAIPNEIGESLKFLFDASGCSIASLTKVIKDPKNKSADNSNDNESVTTSSNTNENEQEDTVYQDQEEKTITLDFEKIIELLGRTGFNTGNEEMISGMKELLEKWGITKNAQAVLLKEGENQYQIKVTLRLQNKTNNGKIKLIEFIPKELAQSATMIESNIPFTILENDPIIQFEMENLSPNQEIELTYWAKEAKTMEEANDIISLFQNNANTPPVFFAEGEAVQNQNSGFSITGLASGIQGYIAPLLLVIVLAGLVFISVRVVKGSVDPKANPILKLSKDSDKLSKKRITPDIERTRKIWKEN